MKRLMVLVMVALLMATMLMITATPIMAAATRPPVASIQGGGGTPLPMAVCESQAATSPSVGWRNGTCWAFHTVP